jgi:hypothetical protein
MISYQVIYYCDDEIVTYYERTVVSCGNDLDCSKAIESVFNDLPSVLPKNIVGTIVTPRYYH